MSKTDIMMKNLQEKWDKESEARTKWCEQISKIKLGEYEGLKISFSEPVSIRQFKLNNTKDVLFKTVFNTKHGQIGVNTRKSRKGFDIKDLLYRDFIKIINIQVVKYDLNSGTFQQVKNKLYDSQTWSDLTEDDFKHIYDPMIIRFRNISKLFPSYVIDCLEEAFKNKTKYSYGKCGSKRDYSVSTQMDDDGVFRAYFSSEYHLCGNGDYYLLLNPTTAVFMETD